VIFTHTYLSISIQSFHSPSAVGHTKPAS
jgi:hypothetical protein